MNSLTAKCILAGLGAGFFVAQASAGLLIYEGFVGYEVGSLAGQAATGTGLTGQWALRGVDQTNYTATGLSFGSLATTGGAASFSLPGKEVSVIGAEIDLAAPVTGTVYASMLFNFSSLDEDTDSLSGLRISDNIGLENNNRFSTYADAQGETEYIPGVAYNNSQSFSEQILTLGTTYIALSIFENVGETLTSENTGEGSVYVLDEAQFEDFVANGRDESNLTGRTIGSGATQLTAFAAEPSNDDGDTFSLEGGDFLGLASYSDTGGTVAGIYDELRGGTSLDDVVVVPEPASLAFLLGMGMFCSVLIRRRR